MDEDQIADLKQFIATTISQQTAHLATKDELANLATKDELKNLATKDDVVEAVGSLETKMNQRFDELQTAIGEAISENNESADTQITDLQQRVTTLERHFA